MNIPKIKLGNNSEIPQIGLGVFRATAEEAIRAVLWALEAGYRHIDTASIYKNESEVGKGIKESGLHREDIFVTTKLHQNAIEANEWKDATKRSFDLLDLEYVDLFLIHWPCKLCWDAYEYLLELTEERKVRAVGVSNFQIEHLKSFEKRGLKTPMINQIELNPYYQEKKLREYCYSKGIIVEAWSPLGGEERSVMNDPVIISIAQKYGKTPSQIIIRWHIQYGNVLVPKSIKKERIYENIDVFNFELASDDMAKITSLDTGKRGFWDPCRYWQGE